MSAEPTDSAWQAADALVDRLHRASTNMERLELVARTLAAQRAEIVARYEKVAAQIDDDISNSISALVSGPLYARRIREAAPK